MTSSLRLLAILLALALTASTGYAGEEADALRAFKKGVRSKEWKERRSAFRLMASCDSAKAANTLLAATVKEKNAAVALEGIKALGALESEEAQTTLVAGLLKATGRKSIVLLMALARQAGAAGTGALSEILRGADGQKAALAALALGAKAQEYSLADLLAALGHSDWQVVAAAARGIEQMALSATPKSASSSTSTGGKFPDWFPTKDVVRSLARHLETARGVERGDLIRALETITRKRYGWNVDAWKMVAAGERPDSETLRRRKYPPQMFGIPLYGRSICIVVDATVHIDNTHPFTDRKRLQDVCQVEGGREVSWFRINTIEEFNREHVVRGIRDMPTTDQKFEVFFSALEPDHVFGKLVAASASNKDKAIDRLSKIKYSNGNDLLTTMNEALDVSGRNDSAAWEKGPDMVVCVCSSDAAHAKETDPEVIGAAIGLKAGSRMVRIESVGVYHHAFVMLKLFAGLSGGRYVNLEK